jgi:hypothetical protein
VHDLQHDSLRVHEVHGDRGEKGVGARRSIVKPRDGTQATTAGAHSPAREGTRPRPSRLIDAAPQPFRWWGKPEEAAEGGRLVPSLEHSHSRGLLR